MYNNCYYEKFFYTPKKRNYFIYNFWNINHAGELEHVYSVRQLIFSLRLSFQRFKLDL